MGKKGHLVLENGQTFEGDSFGFEDDVDGEVVFNTGMVGYPEGFTDPSYCGQILVMTYPLIGNYGVPSNRSHQGVMDYLESERIHIRGLIVSTYVENNSHWQSSLSLKKWLRQGRVPALTGIDTRSLTKTLREKGVMKGKIIINNTRQKSGFSFPDINKENLVNRVSCSDVRTYGEGDLRILLIDCGLKYNQIKLMLRNGMKLIRVPWDYNPFIKPGAMDFDAVFISNGPGDPKMAVRTITTVKEAIKRKIPIMGICLGNQILALASGADTYKLKYGHRSQNQPVKDEVTGRCYVTTQNHGFAVAPESLREGWQVWFRNLNDNTCEGIRHTSLPFFSCQFHPESTPGPTDTEWIFQHFKREVKKWKKIQ